MLVKEGARGKGCKPFNNFSESVRFFFLICFIWSYEIILLSEHICFTDTVILYISTFAGFLCTSVKPKVRHSVKFKMAPTCPLKTGTF